MLSMIEKLQHSTVRIEAFDAKGSVSTGTGFFFGFDAGDGYSTPVIVTNKHVVRGCVRCAFHLTRADANGEVILGEHDLIELSARPNIWIGHPDPAIDLAICPLGPILNLMEPKGKRAFICLLDKSIIPHGTLRPELDAVEDIVMIGYPNGLWDSKNNLPIVRRGITATPSAIDYNGKSEFLIDAACFPGSSGSPVFIANRGWVPHKNGDVGIGQRLLFLGVLYAGPQVSVTGRIVIQAAPTAATPVPVVNTMMNLGICIKAEKVLDFQGVLQAHGMLPPPPKSLAANDTAA